MPVEIKELNIKISLDGSDTAANSNTAASGATGGDSDAQAALVEIVVEKVLEIIKNKTER